MPTLLDKVMTHSNQIGITFFLVGTLTNDEITSRTIGNMATMEALRKIGEESNLSVATVQGFSALEESLSLSTSNLPVPNEQEIILDFANRLVSASRDIDPELNRIIQNHFWDML